MREKLINGFDWDRKISTINNNELQPQNTNQNLNKTQQFEPSSKGKPLDRRSINSLNAGASKVQSLVTQNPKRNKGSPLENSDELPLEVSDEPNSQVIIAPKKVRQPGYKNVSGMSENDW